MSNSRLVEYVIIGVLAYGGYLFIKNKLEGVGYSPVVSKDELAQNITAAGGNVKTTSLGTFYEIPGGVQKLPETAQLRRWESALISIDKHVRGDFLTRWALS